MMGSQLMQRVIGCLLSVLVGVFSLQASAATLQAFVDRNEVLVDESFRLSLRYDGGQSGQPDFSPLEKDFEILSRSQSSQLRLVNGKRESWVQWDLTLLAKRAGTLILPSIEYQGVRSQPLSISVRSREAANSGGLSASAGRQRDYFVELELDKDKLRVQEQLLLTVRLMSSVSLSNLQGGELDVPTAKVITLGDKRYEQIRQGVRYGVYEVRYALFPQESGTLQIPPVTFLAERGVTRSLFRSQRGQLVRLQGENRTLRVLPRAPGFTADRWLPASRAGLEQQWAPESLDVRVGEPITRTLQLRAEGVGQAQLPPLSLPEINGVKFYREPAQTEEQQTESGMVATRIERIGMVASQAGPLVLPEVRLRWWDTQSNQSRELLLPETTLQVKPAAVGVVPSGSMQSPVHQPLPATRASVEAKSASELTRWLLWSNGLWALLCLGLGWMWWRARNAQALVEPKTDREELTKGSEKQALTALEIACRGDDPAKIRGALLCWAQAHWPEEPAMTLCEVGRRLGQEAITTRLQSLDRNLYGPDQAPQASTLDAEALINAVRSQRRVERSSTTWQDDLPELYEHSVR